MPVTPWSVEGLLESLIAFPSVSDRSNRDVSQWVAARLSELGFEVECQEYLDAAGIEKVNVVGRRAASGQPTSPRGGLAYFSHSDVVPADRWQGPGAAGPFHSVACDGRIYGRGSCDMKGSLACMLAAASRINAAQQTAPLTIVCTADEEVGFAGAKQLVAHSKMYRRLVEEQPLGIVGEPTMLRVVHAHKGIEGYRITSHGRAAHSSSREGLNANLAMVPMLVELKRLYEQSESDPALQHPAFDPPTLTWNFGVSDQATAINVTPAISRAWVSFRPMPGVDGATLVEQMRACAQTQGLSFEPIHSGPPLWRDPHSAAIKQVCQLAGCEQAETVCYATDGGQFSELDHLVVWGPGDIAQAHTEDEWISDEQRRTGAELYEAAVRQWCC